VPVFESAVYDLCQGMDDGRKSHLYSFTCIFYHRFFNVVGHWFTLVTGMKFDALLLYLARARLASTIGKNKL